MSIEADGRRIHCDGEGCHAVTSHPVALRQQLLLPEPGLPTAEGWLFINRNGAIRHFCPLCSLKQLDFTVTIRLEKPSQGKTEKKER